MHEIFGLVANMAGFTPPLSNEGKRRATVGDAALRSHVMLALYDLDVVDLSGAASHILSRDNQAKLVRYLSLIDMCAMPINWYKGSEFQGNNHTLSTVLESVVGDAVLNGNMAFVAEIAKLLIELASGTSGDESASGGAGEVPVQASPQVSPAYSVPENAVSLVYEWAAGHADRAVNVEWVSGDGFHECHLTAGSFYETARANNKREAKRIACFKLWEAIKSSPQHSSDNVIREDVVGNYHVGTPSDPVNDSTTDSANEGEGSDRTLSVGDGLSVHDLVECYEVDDDLALWEEISVEDDGLTRGTEVNPVPMSAGFALSSWLT